MLLRFFRSFSALNVLKKLAGVWIVHTSKEVNHIYYNQATAVTFLCPMRYLKQNRILFSGEIKMNFCLFCFQVRPLPLGLPHLQVPRWLHQPQHGADAVRPHRHHLRRGQEEHHPRLLGRSGKHSREGQVGKRHSVLSLKDHSE